MRHGRKSEHQRFDGHKLSAAATNTSEPLITAVVVAPASEQLLLAHRYGARKSRYIRANKVG